MHPYAKLAVEAIREKAKNNRKTEPASPLPRDFDKRAGVFVSIKKQGKLRGCVGTIYPTCRNIAEEIIENGISASTKDRRFDPVREGELDELTVSVDVLSEPEAVSSLDELDPKKYGAIVSDGTRRGLLLPDLEGIDTPEQQVEICRKKGTIPAGSKVSLQRFTVTRYR